MNICMTLAGVWQAELPGLGTFAVQLPGTLDTNGVGLPDAPGLRTRLTRCHTWVGQVVFRRSITLPAAEDGRLFILAERARKLTLRVNGQEVPPIHAATLSTPYLFEVTAWAGQTVRLALTNDNSYAGWPQADILNSSVATDETQTNWNGIIGRFAVLRAGADCIETVRVYPQQGGQALRVEAELLRRRGCPCELELESPAFAQTCVRLPLAAAAGMQTAALEGIALAPDAVRWDEAEGRLYPLTARLLCAGKVLDTWQGRFGVRTFGANPAACLVLNSRVIFLRGEANCAVFPQTGHPPMDKVSWREILRRYASYGVNCMRFHSWCPPEAAFAAADELGMLMQPELSDWNCASALTAPEAVAYYTDELREILRCFGNHPSFVMLTLGNELQTADAGREAMDRLLALAKRTDPTRLYANSSNWNYGEKGPDAASDFYTSMACRGAMLRATSSPMIGHLNCQYPSACTDYAQAAAEPLAQGKPVFGFEVGQYEILPDFAQLAAYTGVTRAENLSQIRENVQTSGQTAAQWRACVEATGELALRCYREEVEAVLRTQGMSGLSLLGLQDFPGQGTALVGMMDANLEPKPYAFAQPERFRAFFASMLPLALLPRYTYRQGETLCAAVKFANYGKTALSGTLRWTLRQKAAVLRQGEFEPVCCGCGALYSVGQLELPLTDSLPAPARLDLDIDFAGCQNSYPLWLYPREVPVVSTVPVAEALTDDLLRRVLAGGKLYLEPPATAQALPGSVAGQFSTDFWSVGTFPAQSGCMGLLIDAAHPALAAFPTETHADYQWWSAAHGRGIPLPRDIAPIVTMLDSITSLRHLALLAEFRVGRGAVMLSGMALHQNLTVPENSALLASILAYMQTPAFAPKAALPPQTLCALIGGAAL